MFWKDCEISNKLDCCCYLTLNMCCFAFVKRDIHTGKKREKIS